MKLILDATVAGKSQVLADGLVRVHVTDAGTGATVGRLSLTAELWEWVKLWAVEGMLAGWEIEIREQAHEPDRGKRPETMRGRLLEAVEIAAEGGNGGKDAAAGEDGGKGSTVAGKTRISPLFKQLQEHKRGKLK